MQLLVLALGAGFCMSLVHAGILRSSESQSDSFFQAAVPIEIQPAVQPVAQHPEQGHKLGSGYQEHAKQGPHTDHQRHLGQESGRYGRSVSELGADQEPLVTVNCRQIVAYGVDSWIKCKELTVSTGEPMSYDGYVKTEDRALEEWEQSELEHSTKDNSGIQGLTSQGESSPYYPEKAPAKCLWDKNRAKKEPKTACLCPASRMTCSLHRESCVWYEAKDTPFKECISKAEKFYNVLGNLLHKRGKKSFELNIRYGASLARGELPYGPYGPAVIGQGNPDATKTYGFFKEVPDYRGDYSQPSYGSRYSQADYGTGHTPADYGTGHPPADYGTGYTPANYGTGYTPANYGTGYTPANYGMGYTPANYGTGYTPANYGTGYTPANYGTGYTPANYGTGYTPENVGTGYTQPNYGTGYTQPNYDMGMGYSGSKNVKSASAFTRSNNPATSYYGQSVQDRSMLGTRVDPSPATSSKLAHSPATNSKLAHSPATNSKVAQSPATNPKLTSKSEAMDEGAKGGGKKSDKKLLGPNFNPSRRKRSLYPSNV